eukprot:11295650-Prorocentrum_lima.AAC.1
MALSVSGWSGPNILGGAVLTRRACKEERVFRDVRAETKEQSLTWTLEGHCRDKLATIQGSDMGI